MRHQKATKKLGRNSSHRSSLLSNLAMALFRHERIETTEVKAKALRSYAEKLITLGKRGDLHARRLAARNVHDHEILQKLFSEIGPRFKERQGGYTRVLKTGTRRGDAADLAFIELVDFAGKKETTSSDKASSESK
ncbi:MAG: 50S ribosomal protein L17 [Deltaproteobacteria bacterium]|nr:50S ribosomal protein L17 [Deltaproteobacteria bacterium]